MSSLLKIIVDTPCQIYCDYEYKGELNKDSIFKLDLRKGIYLLEFKLDDTILLTQEYCMKSNDEEDLLKISLQEKVKMIEREKIHNEINNKNVQVKIIDDSFWIVDEIGEKISLIPFGLHYYRFDKAGLLSVNVGGRVYSEPFIGCEYLIEGGKWGAINKNGEIQISPLYDEPIVFDNGMVTTAKIDNKTYFINKWGEVAFQNIYDLVGEYKENLCIVGLKNTVGIINEYGNNIVDFKYEKIIDTANLYKSTLDKEDTFLVKEKGKWGILDRGCKMIYPCHYEKMELNNNILFVSYNGKYGVLDRLGKVLVPVKYDSIINIEDFLWGTLNGIKEVFTLRGESFLPDVYDEIIYEKFLRCFKVSKKDKWGLLDNKGTIICPITYDCIEHFEYFESPLLVTLNEKKGLLDNSGKRIIDFLYDDIKLGGTAGTYREYIVAIDGKYGLLNYKCDIIVDIAYDSIECVSNHSYLVTNNKMKGIFETAGDLGENYISSYIEILPIIYENIEAGIDQNWIITYQNKKGVIYRTNMQVIDSVYDDISKTKYGRGYKVSLDKKVGLFDEYGSLTYDVVYDNIKVEEEVIICDIEGNVIIYDYDGGVVFDNKYEFVGSCYNREYYLEYGKYGGYVIVKRNHKWGCLNAIPNLLCTIDEVHNMIELIPCDYDDLAYEDMSLYSEDETKDLRIKYFVKKDGNNLHYYLYDVYDSGERNPNKAFIVDERVINSVTPYYMFLDTETTGLFKNKQAPRLIQISWIISDKDGKIIKTENHIIKPDNFEIPIDVAKLHGITTEKAKKIGEYRLAVLDIFFGDIQDIDCIVGHNIDFDVKVLQNEFKNLLNKDVFENKQLICTMRATSSFCKIPGINGYKYPQLNELYKKLFSQTFSDAHNSLADVKATYKCFFKLKEMNILNS